MKSNLKRMIIAIVTISSMISFMPFTTAGADDLIQKDDTGDQVQILQSALIESGYLEAPADGIFGDYTLAALTLFQEEYGLNPTGIADQETLNVISIIQDCVQTDPDVQPEKKGYFRNIEILSYPDGKYFVKANTVSDRNMILAHEALLAVTRAYNESENIPARDLAAALVSDDPHASLIFVRDLTDAEIPEEGLTVRYYDMDTLEVSGEPVELSAEDIKAERSFMFRNIRIDTDQEGNLSVAPDTVSEKSMEKARKIYCAVRHAFMNSDEIPEDEVDLVQVDINALPEGIEPENTVYDKKTGNYYVERSIIQDNSVDVVSPTAIKDSSGFVTVVSSDKVQVLNADDKRSESYNNPIAAEDSPSFTKRDTSPSTQNISEPESYNPSRSVTVDPPVTDVVQPVITQTEPSTILDNPTAAPSGILAAEQPDRPEPVTQAIPQETECTEPAVPVHNHDWKPVYKTVHHDAVTHQEPIYKTIHHDAVTHEEPVYEQVWIDDQVIQGDFLGYKSTDYGVCICHTCGNEFVGWEAYDAHTTAGGGWCSSDGYRTETRYKDDTTKPVYDQIYIPGHYEQISAGTQTVIDQPAFDEQIQDGYTTIVDIVAYDEQQIDYYECSCGAMK